MIFTEDITRRKDAEQTRLRLEQQIAERSVAERQQLGRELHDGVGQQVTVIGMIAAALKDELAAAPSGTPDELLDKLDENVAAAKQQIRSLISGLSPVDVEGRGLSSALERLTLDTAATWGVACRLECQDDVPSTSSFVATQLFLIAAEAARNAAKHAAASEIVIRLSDHDGIRLVVSDNGVGLPPADERNASGMGLRIMRYRAGLIGAELLLESPPQGGTIVSCFLKPGQQEENRKPHDE